jgi:adenylate cyclase
MTASETFHIEFIGEKTIAINKGESVLDAALKAGIPHYHTCGGHARCSTCRILVSNGKENLSAINEKELALRERLPFPLNVRLACQTFVEKARYPFAGSFATYRM